MGSDAVISVTDLTVTIETRRGAVEAVRGVSFDLRAREALGIVGESGSGKTVTCRALLGLLPPNARVGGSIVVADAEVTALPTEALATVRGRTAGMIFQTPSSYLDPLRTVGAQIGEGVRAHFGASRQAARTRAIELLRHVHIDDPERRIDLYPHELSGGMKQRVMIGGALACRPGILVADEPTTALDVTVQARIIELLRRLRNDDGLSLILVSHDLGVVASLCDRVVVMREGIVVEDGPTREVILHPQSDYTRELIAAHPSIDVRDARDDGSGSGGSAPILAVEHLSVMFGRRRGRLMTALLGPGVPPFEAVRDVSFTVADGEILGIVGESGSGKTTIGRAIVGLTAPTEGDISFRGEVLDPNGRSRSSVVRRAIQLVFQDPYASLNPRMSVGQTLAEPLRRHHLVPGSAVRGRVAELMGWVELAPALLNRRPHELSGGQRQRVAIARALAAEPQLLVADEVTSALDVTIQKQILSLLRRLSQELGLNLVIISHDLGVVRMMCHRVVVVRRGRVVETGTTEEVMSFPRDDYTRDLIAAVPRLPSSDGAAYV
jgi:peptide/nickel transport system ATP-binding protein